jgi:hypothetical protein
MTVSELLRELACREISLVKEGDKLSLKGKGAALLADLRQELKAHRRKLLATVGGSNAGEYFGPPRTQNSLDSPARLTPSSTLSSPASRLGASG